MIATSKTPAVAYYRMSTDRQDKSIAEQRDAVEQFASEGGT
jgi:DNA invertase Pin-like site-specific DNA recombinase